MLNFFWGLVVKPLCQDRRRSSISVVGIALGIALIFSVNLSIGRARESIRANNSFFEFADREISSRFGETIPVRIYENVLKIGGIWALPVKIQSVRLVPGETQAVFVATDLIKLPYFTDQIQMEPNVGKGLESLRSPAVYISERVQQEKGIQPEDTIDLETKRGHFETVKVLGILPKELFQEPFILGDISLGEKWAGSGIDRILIHVSEQNKSGLVLEELSSVLTSDLSMAPPRDRILRTEDVIRSFDYNLRALSFMVLLIGLFLVYNTIFVSVIRRRAEIGILRALGMTRREIMGLFMLEAAIIGALGSSLGLFLGFVLSSLSDQGVTATLGSLYGLRILGTDQGVLQWMLFPFLAGLLGSVVASLGPAHEASWIVPAEAMREGTYQHSRVPRYGIRASVGSIMMIVGLCTAFSLRLGSFPYTGFAGLLVLILGFVLVVPWMTHTVARRSVLLLETLASTEGRLGALNLLGSSGRTSMAVSAISVSLACTVGILMLTHSFRVTVENWVDGNLSADVYIKAESCRGRVFCEEVLDASTLDSLRDVTGLRDMYRFRGFEFDYQGQTTHLGFSDISVLHRYSHVRYLHEADPALILKQMTEGDYVMISEPFAHRFRLQPGDVVSIPTRIGKMKFTVSAVFYDYSTELGYMIMDRRFMEPLFGVNDAHTVGLYLDPALPSSLALQNIRRALADKDVVFFKTTELKRAVLGIFERTFAVTRAIYLVALVVALLAVANTLFALMVDRRKDLAVLRYLGMDRRQVFHMVFSESALIALIGSGSGLLLGTPIGLVLIYIINRQSFGWSIDLHPPIVAVAGMVLGMLATTIACSWFPYKLARRMAPSRYISHE